jgi:CxxC motif-containing protein (DUF1111 family)
MNRLKLAIAAFFVMTFALVIASTGNVHSQQEDAPKKITRAAAQAHLNKFRVNGVGQDVAPPAASSRDFLHRPLEAPTGFDNLTNGFTDQGPAFETLNEDNVEANRSFNDNRFIFEEVETVADGVGPTYNAQSCRECHQNVATGGASQVAEHRTGRTDNGVFFESLGGTLIQSRGSHPDVVEHVAFEDEVRTFRLSTNTLGDGFIECIEDSTLLDIQNLQPLALRGATLIVPILEADNIGRIGRFGWKSQHASLQSFAADAYLNEMGITSPLFMEENTSGGNFVGWGTVFDLKPEPEDDGDDVLAFANFMRATKAPSRGPITADVRDGETLFKQIGCNICHTDSIVTAQPGTEINGGTFIVPKALGNKTIHPFSDFLLHDIGTGDGIPFLNLPEYASTANQIHTAPLWALRTRNRLMHDGLSFTKQEAIQRHQGQAATVTTLYNALTDAQRSQILAFLDSL